MATFTEEYSDYLGNAKRLIYKKGNLSLTNEGSTVGDIPASLFGLKKIHSVSTSTTFDGIDRLRYLLFVSSDETELLVVDLEQATDNLRGDRIDVSGGAAFSITIIGE